METVEVVYYTCRNSECPKYRNIFAQGNPLHENCARERLVLRDEQESRSASWLWFAVPAAAALAAAAVVLWRRSAASRSKRTLHEDRKTQTWSGSHAHLDERRGHPVPPPIK